MAAFQLAIEQGADAIELDAKLSRDGYVVVMHDETVDRTTTSHGRVRDMPLVELRKMDAGSHFDIAFKNERIPTLEEVFGGLGQRTRINVELTNYGSPFDALPQKVADLVERYQLQGRVLFSSFNPISLLRMRQLLPGEPIGLLALPGNAGRWARSWLGRLIRYQALHPELRDAGHELVSRTQARGQRVNVYTVNGESDMQRLFEIGVDGFFTDDPLLARRVLKKELGQKR